MKRKQIVIWAVSSLLLILISSAAYKHYKYESAIKSFGFNISLGWPKQPETFEEILDLHGGELPQCPLNVSTYGYNLGTPFVYMRDEGANGGCDSAELNYVALTLNIGVAVLLGYLISQQLIKKAAKKPKA